jgi:uncharacterized protein (UPF0332 family)
MKELTFLKNLKRKKIIQLVEQSEEMKSSYLIKAENCLKSSKLLYQNQLYENSTSEAYYCMYNSLLSLLFRVGIKSENHSASITLLDILFKRKDMAKVLFWSKGERIDKQYYVETQQIVKVTKESCNDMILKAEDFLVKMKLFISETGNEEINPARSLFSNILN